MIPDYQKHKQHRICIQGMILVPPCTIKKNKDLKTELLKYLIHQPMCARDIIQFMTSINLLHVSAPGRRPQEVFQMK